MLLRRKNFGGMNTYPVVQKALSLISLHFNNKNDTTLEPEGALRQKREHFYTQTLFCTEVLRQILPVNPVVEKITVKTELRQVWRIRWKLGRLSSRVITSWAWYLKRYTHAEGWMHAFREKGFRYKRYQGSQRKFIRGRSTRIQYIFCSKRNCRDEIETHFDHHEV